MTHDHAASERERQEYEHKSVLASLKIEQQISLALEGAVRRIADAQAPSMSARETAQTALDAVRKIRSTK